MYLKTKGRKLVAILIAFALLIPYGYGAAFAGSDETAPAFTDVTGHWAEDAIMYAYDNGLMTGTSADKFSPNGNLTRGMAVTALYRAESAPAASGSENPFTDVKDGAYYAEAVRWAAENDIVTGIGGGLFEPNANITREQMAAILLRYANFTGDGPVGAWAIRLDFTDLDQISDWAASGAMFCYMKGVITGKPGNLFDPKANVTRAEFATMLMRYQESLNPKPEGPGGASVKIGLSWMEDINAEEHGEDLQAYIDAVKAAGAEAVLLPLITSAEQAQNETGNIDALIMTGGGDIDPAEYGEAPSDLLEDVDTARDKSDLLLLKAAIDKDIPVLATCRGMQVLNVLQGGTLYQDIPTQFGTSILHRSVDQVDFAYHDITVKSGSFIDQIMGKTRFSVNSWHHQGIKDLGKGLEVTATSDDGMIEAVELQGAAFVLGVGFHPEWLVADGQTEFLAFFERLIEEASK